MHMQMNVCLQTGTHEKNFCITHACCDGNSKIHNDNLIDMRKNKLLKKQKEGKKRMKSIGRVDVPQEAFVSALKIDD